MMETATQYLSMVLMFVAIIRSGLAETDMKAIRHLLWAIIFILAGIADMLWRSL